MRKRTQLTMMGAVILGFVSALFLYGPAKEKDMDSKGSFAGTARTTDVSGYPDVLTQGRSETATFAMG